jgi:hypothetical protein
MYVPYLFYLLGMKRYPGEKLSTEGQNFAPRNKTSYRGTKLLTEGQNFLPRDKTSYQGTKRFT